MDQITGTTSAGLNSNASSNALSPELDKQAFLTLLVTQLRFQDPLNPVENQDFIAQLAQFSQLENLNNISESINTTNLLQQSQHNALSTSLIGKYTLTVGNSIQLQDDGVGTVAYIAPDSGNAEIRVLNSDGDVVYTQQNADVSAGEHFFKWDGKDGAGNRLADGEYTVEVEMLSGESAGQEPTVLEVGRVTAVRFVGGSPILIIDGQEHRMAEIIEVMESLPEG